MTPELQMAEPAMAGNPEAQAVQSMLELSRQALGEVGKELMTPERLRLVAEARATISRLLSLFQALDAQGIRVMDYRKTFIFPLRAAVSNLLTQDQLEQMHVLEQPFIKSHTPANQEFPPAAVATA